MSPRAVDHGTRAVSPTPVVFHSQPHALAPGQANGKDGTRFRKPKKPLSSGFKAIVWTSTPPVGTTKSSSNPAPAVVVSSYRKASTQGAPAAPSLDARISANNPSHRAHELEDQDNFVGPVAPADVGRGGGTGGRRRSPRTAAPVQPHHQAKQQTRLTDISESRGVHAVEAADVPRFRKPAQRFAPSDESERHRVWDRRSASEEFSGRPLRGDSRAGDPLHVPPVRAVRDPPLAALPLDSGARATTEEAAGEESAGAGVDCSSASMPLPSPSRIPSTTGYPHANDIVMERSLSDSSVVTASDFGGSRSHRPIILSTATAMTDEEAVAELSGLLSRGKGLPVVKHATGLGGGKSRKLLKFSKAGGHLTLCGMLPPYFKTKIAVRDVDRVDAKWCCVVVHAKGRSPLRLEVDSFATADTLRLGLMAASRMKPPPPPPQLLPASADDDSKDSQLAPLSPDSDTSERLARVEPDPEQGLSSVRPGHHQSQVYDPDAALSVAALLAKEMEEERMLALGGVSGGGTPGPGGGVWASSRPPATPGGIIHANDNDGSPPKPLLKRSASMNSVVSSRLSENGGSRGGGTVDPNTNRRSLPRGYGGHVLAPGSGRGEELVVVDAKASLRRLYDAIEGRGMVAIKRNINGKGRSRVMVRSRIKENSIGWSHVLPPFTRKFISVKELLGAHRSSRVVTVNFKNREAVMFETDKLTDALILEQGFVSLAMLQKNEATRS